MRSRTRRSNTPPARRTVSAGNRSGSFITFHLPRCRCFQTCFVEMIERMSVKNPTPPLLTFPPPGRGGSGWGLYIRRFSEETMILGGLCPLTFEVAAVLLLPPDALPVTLATTGLCRKKTLRVPRPGGQRPLAIEVAAQNYHHLTRFRRFEPPKVLRRETHFVCATFGQVKVASPYF